MTFDLFCSHLISTSKDVKTELELLQSLSNDRPRIKGRPHGALTAPWLPARLPHPAWAQVSRSLMGARVLQPLLRGLMDCLHLTSGQRAAPGQKSLQTCSVQRVTHMLCQACTSRGSSWVTPQPRVHPRRDAGQLLQPRGMTCMCPAPQEMAGVWLAPSDPPALTCFPCVLQTPHPAGEERRASPSVPAQWPHVHKSASIPGTSCQAMAECTGNIKAQGRQGGSTGWTQRLCGPSKELREPFLNK